MRKGGADARIDRWSRLLGLPLRFVCLSRATESLCRKALPCGPSFRCDTLLERPALSVRRKLHAHCAERRNEDFSVYFQQFVASEFTQN
jgi:hypothetical protein